MAASGEFRSILRFKSGVNYADAKHGQSIGAAREGELRVSGHDLLPESAEMGNEAELIARIPFGRVGRTEEIAQTVVFLLGGPAFITGAIVPVDGGESLR